MSEQGSSDAFFEDAFAGVPVMAILRGYSPERTVELAERAWDLGLRQVEVPIQSPEAIPALQAALTAGTDRGMGVGAGTVTTTEQVHLAAELGCAFTVAPGTDPEILIASAAVGVPHLPGVSSPSDIQIALKHHLCWVKAFPASVLGPEWIRAVRAPFPQVRIVATGGIDVANATSYLRAGAAVVSLGSALEDQTQLDQIAAMLSAR